MRSVRRRTCGQSLAIHCIIVNHIGWRRAGIGTHFLRFSLPTEDTPLGLPVVSLSGVMMCAVTMNSDAGQACSPDLSTVLLDPGVGGMLMTMLS